VASGEARLILKGHHDPVCWAFSPDGKTIASGGLDKTVKLWDVATGSQRATFVGHQDSVHGVTFSPDGRTLASCGSSRSIKLWDVAGMKEKSTLVEVVGGHPLDWVNCLAFSPDGKTLASGNNDTEVELWDVASGEKRFLNRCHPCSEHVGLLFLEPTNSRIVAAGQGRCYHRISGLVIVGLARCIAKITNATARPTASPSSASLCAV
jgi:WD40 repeat protein